MNALLIGATGMLWPLVETLLDQGAHGTSIEHITLMARSKETFVRQSAALPASKAARLHFLPVDYNDLAGLEDAIQSAPAPTRRSTLVVAWIHSSAPGALPTILNHLDLPETRATQVVQLFGSASKRAGTGAFYENQCLVMGARKDVLYQRVVLGFVREQTRSRWLTDEEVSRGTFDAIQGGEAEHIVGVVEPWNERP